MRKNRFAVILSIVAIVAVLSFAAGYLFTKGKNFPVTDTAAVSSQSQTPGQPSPQASPAQTNGEIPFMPGVFATEASESHLTLVERILNIFFRLLLAVVLSAALAFRPRRNVPLFQRNLNVAQTQILLAVVAAALMIIVGDNTARAFAIFAAVSLVRFRTNIKDPKEITVLLISLALGLATGVGRWELGLFLCLFVLGLLWLLEYNESEQVFRSMELTVKTRNTDNTENLLKKVFAKYRLEAEMRELQPSTEEEPLGSIVYYLNLRLSVSTDRLSDQIMNSDANDIEGIQWKQQKSTAAL